MDTPANAPVYLDYNATAPLRPAVRAAIAEALDRFGNPSSVHRLGRTARAAIEDAREVLAKTVGATPNQIVFTSGGTEANALAMRGIAAAIGAKSILAGATEHPSVLAHVAAKDLIPVDGNGVIDLSALDAMLAARPGPALIAVMAANNETGVIQPLSEVVTIARKHGARVHCDAVQTLGRMPIDLAALGVDSVSVSAHKIGGLKGVGALVLGAGIEPVADAIGGGQERRRRAGTENTIGIAAFGAALRDVPALLRAMPTVTALRDRLEARLCATVPKVAIHGAQAARLGNTSCIGLAGLTSETQLIALDLAGIAVSAGAACSSGKVAASHVLLAMGVAPEAAACAIRISLGWDSTAADIERFTAAWLGLYERHYAPQALAAAASA